MLVLRLSETTALISTVGGLVVLLDTYNSYTWISRKESCQLFSPIYGCLLSRREASVYICRLRLVTLLIPIH